MAGKFFRGAKPVGDFIRGVLEPALAKRGFSQASLLLDWSAIVGVRVSNVCEPARLQWPSQGPKSGPKSGPARPAPAVLWLRVAPGRALDVQYQTSVILERVNAHFGWRCVATIRIAPEPKRPVTTVSPAGRPTSLAARSDAAAITGPIADEGLRDALTRLGAEVLNDGR